MRIKELRGYKSHRALGAFHTLMLGLKMLPAYMGKTYEEFLDAIEKMAPPDQEKMIREAALFVTLQKDELEAILSFCLDPNGVPYSAENLEQLNPNEIHEAIVAVCVEIGKIKIDMVGEREKKN